MDVDVDMDAPQISTLREDESPPPAQARVSKFRVKLRVKEADAASASGSSPRKAQPGGESEEDEDELDDEEEEDQLADDDDISMAVTPAPSIIATPTRSTAAVKRGQAKGRSRASKGRGKGAPEPGPMMSWFEVSPSQDPKPSPLKPTVEASVSGTGPIPKPPRKRPPRKNPNPKASRKAGPKALKLVLHDQEDPGSISEAFIGTAASSPVIRDINTPELDVYPADPCPITHSHSVDENNMDMPIPVYPLPSKPFLVQPLPKIGTGFAPLMPLDKSGVRVRHWRQAHREIRGIAGGRWFARTWVGDKESDFASAASVASALAIQNQAANPEKVKDKVGPSALALPKLPTGAMSISAAGKAKSSKSKLGKADGGSTAASSRSASVVPDIHIVRPPQATKMRNILAGPAPDAASGDVEAVSTPF